MINLQSKSEPKSKLVLRKIDFCTRAINATYVAIKEIKGSIGSIAIVPVVEDQYLGIIPPLIGAID
jgi:hypothetical protein